MTAFMELETMLSLFFLKALLLFSVLFLLAESNVIFPWTPNHPVQLRPLGKCCFYQVRTCCPVYASCGSRPVNSVHQHVWRYICTSGISANCIRWEKRLFTIRREVPVFCLRYSCSGADTRPNKFCTLTEKKELTEHVVVAVPSGVRYRGTRSNPLVPDPSYPPEIRDIVPVPQEELRAAEERREQDV